MRSLEQARKAREARPADWLTYGNNGQPFEHPYVTIEREASRDALVCAHELLLTPAARAGLPAPRRYREETEDD